MKEINWRSGKMGDDKCQLTFSIKDSTMHIKAFIDSVGASALYLGTDAMQPSKAAVTAVFWASVKVECRTKYALIASTFTFFVAFIYGGKRQSNNRCQYWINWWLTHRSSFLENTFGGLKVKQETLDLYQKILIKNSNYLPRWFCSLFQFYRPATRRPIFLYILRVIWFIIGS